MKLYYLYISRGRALVIGATSLGLYGNQKDPERYDCNFGRLVGYRPASTIIITITMINIKHLLLLDEDGWTATGLWASSISIWMDWIGSPSPGYKLVIFKESKAEALIKILLDSVQCLVPPFCSVQLDSKTNPLQMGNENPFINFSFCAKIIHASQWMSDLMCKIWFKDFNVFQNKFWIILDNMPPNKGSLVLKEGESP